MDYYPEEKWVVNLLCISADAGIPEELLKADIADRPKISRMKKILENASRCEESVASSIVDMWISALNIRLLSETNEIPPLVEEWSMETDIRDLKLPTRAWHCLRRVGIYTLGDLCNLTPEDLKRVNNLGRRSYEMTLCRLNEMGLSLREPEEENGEGNKSLNVSGNNKTGEEVRPFKLKRGYIESKAIRWEELYSRGEVSRSVYRRLYEGCNVRTLGDIEALTWEDLQHIHMGGGSAPREIRNILISYELLERLNDSYVQAIYELLEDHSIEMAISGDSDRILKCQRELVDTLPWDKRNDWDVIEIRRVIEYIKYCKGLDTLTSYLGVVTVVDYRNNIFKRMVGDPRITPPLVVQAFTALRRSMGMQNIPSGPYKRKKKLREFLD